MKQSYVGEIIHGQTGTRLYRMWKNMKMRCFSKICCRYKTYGGRGITICDDWLDFSNFYDWAMKNEYNDTMSIDRIDVNEDYTPENCQFIPFNENHQRSVDYHLENKTGIFSVETSEKSKEANRKNNGKKTYCEKNDVVMEFRSRGELIDFIAKETGRNRHSVKSHVTLCLRGKSDSCSGYKIYD